jgi:hypothetical protein
MGRLTEDATRLCAEIAALRDARLGFVQGLRDTVSTTQADLRSARAKMGKRARTERGVFTSSLVGFAGHLAGLVAGLRQEFASDLAGAHSAWTAVTRPGRPRTQSGAQGQGKGRSRSKSRSGR